MIKINKILNTRDGIETKYKKLKINFEYQQYDC